MGRAHGAAVGDARARVAGSGYAVTGEDTLAERPEVGLFRVRWVRTSNLVLRKDLSGSREQASQPSTAVSQALQGVLRGAAA